MTEPDKVLGARPVARLHLIDVGQGAATLFEFSCAAVLVDTGGEGGEGFESGPMLKAYLDAFFKYRADLDRTLELMVLTHPHLDHTRNVELVRSLGADHVIDYTAEDFTMSSERYDVIMDNVANRPILDIRRVLAAQGKYLVIGGGGPDANPWIGAFKAPVKAWFISLR